MKRRYLGGMVWLCGAVLVISGGDVGAATFAGGDGTAANPYQIAAPEQLVALGADPNLADKHFVLIRDLDMARVDPNAMSPIGADKVGILSGGFEGEFDGKGHEIKNLCILRPNAPWVGLFARVEKSVRNLRLKDVTVKGKDVVGGLAGELGGGTIQNCSITGSVTGVDNVGGLVGWSHNKIMSCTATVEVHGEGSVGGLVGEAAGDIVSCRVTAVVDGNVAIGGLAGSLYKNASQCSASGRVTGKSRVGGLVGAWMASFALGLSSVDYSSPNDVDPIAHLTQCSSDCTVTGTEEIGGLLGAHYGTGVVEDCYSLGPVQGSAKVGGLVGHRMDCGVVRCFSSGVVKGKKDTGGLIGLSDPTQDANELEKYPPCQCIIEEVTSKTPEAGPGAGKRWWRRIFRPAVLSCFWDGETSGVAQPSGSTSDSQGMTRLTTGQMRKLDTFKSQGWDFDAVWVMPEGKPSPRLRWEQVER